MALHRTEVVLNPNGDPVTVYVRPERDPVLDAWWYDSGMPPWRKETRIEIVAIYLFLLFWAWDWGYALYLWLTGRLTCF